MCPSLLCLRVLGQRVLECTHDGKVRGEHQREKIRGRKGWMILPQVHSYKAWMILPQVHSYKAWMILPQVYSYYLTVGTALGYLIQSLGSSR
jgi:hypothetical protein